MGSYLILNNLGRNLIPSLSLRERERGREREGEGERERVP